jgi:hypothetical protein
VQTERQNMQNIQHEYKHLLAKALGQDARNMSDSQIDDADESIDAAADTASQREWNEGKDPKNQNSDEE